MPESPLPQTLAIVSETSIYTSDGHIYMHLSFGRIVDALARRYEHVILCMPTHHGTISHACDYRLQQGNISLVPQPPYGSMLSTLRHPQGILSAYLQTLRQADVVFVRGMLPLAGFFYLIARCFRHHPVHWIVGNPVALLKSHRRASVVIDTLGLLYSYQNRFVTRLGNRLTHGAFLCNGEELGRIYASRRTKAVISSTITEEEFFERFDTCLENPIRLLFVGFVRPEKGITYLLEALPQLRCGQPWHLSIVGPWDQHPGHKRELEAQVSRLGIADRISWKGYVSCGPELWSFLRGHDILILPALSEGTPRVLVEARANSLPIVATRVGGIPTSVTDGIDGILVRPKDADEIARAIDHIVTDGPFRRRLIRSGFSRVRHLTVGCFVEALLAELRPRARRVSCAST